MNILICDDLKEDADMLVTMLAETGFEVQTSVFTCPKEALCHVSSGATVDVCFLDIVMPEMEGVTLAKKLREAGFAGEIIFLTASNNFAHESYNVKAFDYLLKPVNYERLKNVMNALQILRKNIGNKGIFVKMHRFLRFIAFRDISSIEAHFHYVCITMADNTIIETQSSFGEMEKGLLIDNRFAKCHRSHIVNLDEAITIKQEKIIMKSNKEIPISRSYPYVKEEVFKWIFRKKQV
jgi:DNA-binding LytR/AlgR family response regulator